MDREHGDADKPDNRGEARIGAAAFLAEQGVPVGTVVAKVGEQHSGAEDAVALIESGAVQLVVNTPRGRGPRADGVHIRRAALANQVPCLTTVAAARAAAAGIADWASHRLSVISLQEMHGGRDMVVAPRPRAGAGVPSHGAAPGGAVPGGTTPEGVPPDGEAPDGVPPDGAAPDGAAPDGVAPGGAVPGGAAEAPAR